MAVSPRLAGYKRHPVACDHAIALTVLAINLLRPGAKHGAPQIELTVTGTLLILLACLPLAFRRQAPLTVLVIMTA